MPNFVSWLLLLSLAFVANATPVFHVNRAQHNMSRQVRVRSYLMSAHHWHQHRGANAALFVFQPSSSLRSASTSTRVVGTFSSIIATKTRKSSMDPPKIMQAAFHGGRFTSTPLLLHVASLSTLESGTKVDAHTHTSTSMITEELNPSQKEATLRPRYSITRVIAGPGAGKTKVLTCRIAHLLLDKSHLTNDYDQSSSSSSNGHQRWDKDREGILAVTFTKKAAMEMERRLTELLSSAITHQEEEVESKNAASPGISTGDDNNDDDYLEEGEFVQYGNYADPDDDESDNVKNDRAARQLTRQTTVGTFHSVCSKILRKFGKQELGNLPSVLKCLGVTKNNAGATVHQKGIIQTDSVGEDDGQESTTNNNQNMMIQTLDGSFNILDQSDQLRLLKEVLQSYSIQLKSPSSSGGGGNNNDIRPITVLNAISLLNTRDAMRMTPSGSSGGSSEDDDISDKVSKKVFRIATEIQLAFQRAKYSQNSVDFDDLILLTRELLLCHSEVREVLHRRWRHVLVDEFQDTSQVQLDLVRLLTTNSLFAVGDGDQSIYSWRGASPESMSDFEVAFHDRAHGWEGLLNNHDGGKLILSQYLERIISGGQTDFQEEVDDVLKVKSVYLMENYRSTTNIVKAAQRIISTNSENRKSDEEKASSAQDDLRRDMKPMRGIGPSPRVLACKDAKAEAKFVVKTVNSMVDSGDLSPSSSTVAFIYRTNAQSRLLEEACVANNLRYVVRGSSGTFYKRAEIQDCMSFLKMMYNPRDRSAWARAVKAPSRGIGEASLNEFFRYCDVVKEKFIETATDRDVLPTPMDVILSLAPDPNNADNPNDIGMLIPPRDIMSTRTINRFIPFASSLRSLRRKAEVQAVPDFLLSVIDDLGLKGHFDTISKTRDEYEDRLGNVMELVGAGERYKEDGPCISSTSEDDSMETPLGNFLDDVALIADLAPDESDSEEGGDSRIVANLMTIHSSKGMEFDAVFLVGNEEGTFPTQRSIGEGEGSIELSEERRLCYVAMTRAKTHLVLTWRKEVSYFAGASIRYKDADRSRFLDVLVSSNKQGAKTNKGGSMKKPGAQVKNNNFSSARNSTYKRNSGQLDAMTKRELHSEANRYLASGSKKSWDDWEPASQKKLIGKVPTIDSKPSSGIDRRQILPSSQAQTRQISNTSDRGRVMPSQQSQGKTQEINQTRVRMAPRQPSERSVDRRQVQPSPRSMSSQNGATSKKSSETSGRNNSSPGGEAPPPGMDSTLFFPVGSSVKHKLHGRGVVQTPPNTDAEFAEKMLVRVKFLEENMEWDLPMGGISHTYE